MNICALRPDTGVASTRNERQPSFFFLLSYFLLLADAPGCDLVSRITDIGLHIFLPPLGAPGCDLVSRSDGGGQEVGRSLG